MKASFLLLVLAVAGLIALGDVGCSSSTASPSPGPASGSSSGGAGSSSGTKGSSSGW